MAKKINNPEINYAGFWSRFVALIIDVICGNVISFVIGFALALLIGAETTKQLSTVLGITIGWFYYAWMESKYGATLGKQFLDLKVTDINGGPVTFLQATGRHFGKLLSIGTLFIGFIMAGLTKKKQGLHDIVSECLVVKK